MGVKGGIVRSDLILKKDDLGEIISKLTKTVTPADAGTHNHLKGLDSGFRR
jgi:hypothetical protein